MSLFARIDEQGKLQLVNHLGIELGQSPEAILSKLDDDRITDADVHHDQRHGYDHDYVTRVRDIEADSPARYNADPDRLFESSGCAGKLAVFAVRPRIPSRRNPTSRCSISAPTKPKCLRRSAVTSSANFTHLPIAGEYMHRDIYDIAEQYSKDTFLMIDKLGTDKMPFFFTLKGRTDALLEKSPLFKPHFVDRSLQKITRLFPSHLPPRMKEWRNKYEHHLLLKMSGDGIAEAQSWLNDYFATAEGAFCVYAGGRQQSVFTPFCAQRAPLSVTGRCMPMRWRIFCRWTLPSDVTIPSGLSIFRRKSTASWCISSTTDTFVPRFPP